MKIALMDRYGANFTEGDNFKHYALSFLEKGCEVFQLDPYTINFENSSGEAYVLRKEQGLKRQEKSILVDLNSFDAIMDLSDIVDLVFANKLSKIKTLHINPPLATYDSADKKTYINNYPEFIPSTIVGSKVDELGRALEGFGGVMVVKDPLGSCGKGVEKIDIKNPNYRKILGKFTENGKKPVVAQKFLELSYEGSKRVAVVGDIADPASYRIIHSYGRRPLKGNWKDNLTKGGIVVELESLRKDERDFCLKVAAKSGLYAVGLDILDDLDEEGNRIPRLVETNAVLALAKGRYPREINKVVSFILNDLLNS
jgi:glutathione synthase/RimK-type ligase-like ATP-grasp enzyme